MAPAVNFTAVAADFKNECTRDLSLRASLPFLVVLVLLVLLVLVVLVLVLVNMPSKPHSDFLASKCQMLPSRANSWERAAENVTDMSPRAATSSMS